MPTGPCLHRSRNQPLRAPALQLSPRRARALSHGQRPRGKGPVDAIACNHPPHCQPTMLEPRQRVWVHVSSGWAPRSCVGLGLRGRRRWERAAFHARDGPRLGRVLLRRVQGRGRGDGRHPSYGLGFAPLLVRCGRSLWPPWRTLGPGCLCADSAVSAGRPRGCARAAESAGAPPRGRGVRGQSVGAVAVGGRASRALASQAGAIFAVLRRARPSGVLEARAALGVASRCSCGACGFSHSAVLGGAALAQASAIRD